MSQSIFQKEILFKFTFKEILFDVLLFDHKIYIFYNNVKGSQLSILSFLKNFFYSYEFLVFSSEIQVYVNLNLHASA